MKVIYKRCKFSLILQNILTREVYVYNIIPNDKSNALYLDFDIDLSNLPDGEYYALMVDNPNFLPIIPANNNIYDIDSFVYITNKGNRIVNGDKYLVTTNIKYYKYLVNDGDFITNAKFFLVQSYKPDIEIRPLKTFLLRLGDYHYENLQMNNNTSYYQYRN